MDVSPDLLEFYLENLTFSRAISQEPSGAFTWIAHSAHVSPAL